MVLVEAALQRAGLEPLDGAHVAPVGLDGEHQARAHGLTVDLHRARAADPVLACLTFAIQVDQARITTIEGLEPGRLQEAFHEHHALQCGCCTAGILLTLDAYLKDHPEPTDAEVKDALAGNLCRCTGYAPIIEAVRNR